MLLSYAWVAYHKVVVFWNVEYLFLLLFCIAFHCVLSIKQIEFGAVQKVSLRSIKINANWIS